MIFVDTNILVPLFVPTSNTGKCQILHGHDLDWHLTDWWQIEFANVLRNLHRSGQIDKANAIHAMEDAIAFIPAASTHPIRLTLTLEIACDANISAYDARFIALARSFGRKLVTEDTRLRKACPGDTLSLDKALALFP